MANDKVLEVNAEWLYDVIRYAEDETLSKSYEISYAAYNSGVSIGAMQIDLANNQEWIPAFTTLMRGSGNFTAAELADIGDIADDTYTSVSDWKADWSAYASRANDALSSGIGKITVDRISQEYFENTMAPRVGKALDAAKDNPNGLGSLSQSHPDYEASIAYVAAWINRTGEPTLLLNYLSGKEVTLGGDNFKAENITLSAIKEYIENNQQFRDVSDHNGRGENFERWADRIERAVSFADSNKTVDSVVSKHHSESAYGDADDFGHLIDLSEASPSYNNSSVETWVATILTDDNSQIEVVFEGTEREFVALTNTLQEKGIADNTQASWKDWFSTVAGIEVTKTDYTNPSDSSGGSGGSGGWSSSSSSNWWSSSSSDFDWGSSSSGSVSSSSWLDD